MSADPESRGAGPGGTGSAFGTLVNPWPRSEGFATNGVFAPRTLDATRYFAWLYSPVPQRRLLEALLGLESEIATSLRPGLDHDVAHGRLQWWREECERSAAGFPLHPLTREIRAIVPLSGGLAGLVDNAAWDLAQATFAGRSELSTYCRRWSQALFDPIVLLATESRGTHATEVTPPIDSAAAIAGPWQDIGALVRELELLANLYGEARAGRLRIPLNELENAGADPADVLQLPWPEPICKIVRERHESLRASLSRALYAVTHPLPGGGAATSALRGLLVWAALAWRTSRRAQRRLPDMIRASRFGPVADSCWAWRVARRSAAGKRILAATDPEDLA